ncbi:MAG TPA: tetratricopeptide repeat protein [Pyrinomonadaceae bacterium]|jgi:tetratricopeptide (TPR) repeat protein
MRNLFLLVCAAALVGCDSAPRPVAENSTANSTAQSSNERPQTVIAHTTENGTPSVANGEKSHWTQRGEAIDTSTYDAEIAKAEKSGSKPAIAAAYLKRANALTKAGQYASALGDYRRTVKNDPSNGEAQEWIMQITSIYDSMNREAPKDGEEPQPLPFKKQ